jgi:HAE1 family hydrophobic/amphiphilic exporter-1
MGILAIIFVYLIMVAQFQSLLSPFIVMFTIPLAFTGGLLALIITNGEISVISMLGFLVLSGVIVNNGIVFVDYINQLRIEGKNKRDAIIETGRTRIRPILMTALTTILAMSTMALGVGMGSEMTQGLAVVTIGGLIYGTILTLIVIPVLYDLFHNK